MNRDRQLQFSLVLAAISLVGGGAFAADEPADFVHQIAPILREHCGKCHLAPNKKGGLGLDTRAALLAGGEEGKVVSPGKSGQSRLLQLVKSRDPDVQMPPQGPRLSEKQVALISRWIDDGLPWDESFTFSKPNYEPPFRPRRPELPPVVDGREHPIDRLIDADLARHKQLRPQPLDDNAFARRTSLDLVGVLPDIDKLNKFLADPASDRRARWIRRLLDNDIDYAEHWLTFWNDLLRNDYGGTGFITGGRKQISKWLYEALITNKPYDDMVRELIVPSPESAGFGEGIRWRGTVSAGQTVEIQFAQSVGQAFLGINLKCASCHDSFIDRWKLDESYGLAAIYATKPLEIHRCDKPIGRTAEARWLFPEIGQVMSTAPQPERLRQLAALMTHPENGRVPRTIVNRLWARLMGRGIVHPLDSMQAPPANPDLLDFLAADFVDHRHNLKHIIELIVTSQAYQSRTKIINDHADEAIYAIPLAKRMTAEQFIDAVWTITDAAPTKFDAPVVRGKPSDQSRPNDLKTLTGQWVWSSAVGSSNVPKAGETVTIHRKFTLVQPAVRAGAVVTVDNTCECYLNGNKFFNSDSWERVEGVPIESRLKSGENEILIVGVNGGSGTNPAAIFAQFAFRAADGAVQTLGTDATWEWTPDKPKNGKFAKEPTNWQPAVPVANSEVWSKRSSVEQLRQLNHVLYEPQRMVRAALLKSDFLQRSLGRPNRDQIVTSRPTDFSTLEAIDLNNDRNLAESLAKGAKHLLTSIGSNPTTLVEHIYLAMLARKPTPEESAIAIDALGSTATEQSVQDLLWALLLQPEFQLIR